MKPAPAKAAAPVEQPIAKTAAEPADAAAKPVPPKRPVFVPPPKPGGNYPGAGGPGKGGKGGPKSNMPKGRIFRHQGR